MHLIYIDLDNGYILFLIKDDRYVIDLNNRLMINKDVHLSNEKKKIVKVLEEYLL